MATKVVTSLEINLADIDIDDLVAFIVKNYSPEEIYPVDELEDWASRHGFVQKDV